MRNEVKEYDGLRIRLLSFDIPKQGAERYFFSEMSTLQASTLIHDDREIVNIKITAYDDQNNYLSELPLKSFKTVADFNRFFNANSDYYIHDCHLEFANNLTITSHDDGEVSIQIDMQNSDFNIVQGIFNKYGVDLDLVLAIKKKPRYYIEIDKNNQIIGEYLTFEDYVEKRMK